jgi:hypothetical protein
MAGSWPAIRRNSPDQIAASMIDPAGQVPAILHRDFGNGGADRNFGIAHDLDSCSKRLVLRVRRLAEFAVGMKERPTASAVRAITNRLATGLAGCRCGSLAIFSPLIPPPLPPRPIAQPA